MTTAGVVTLFATPTPPGGGLINYAVPPPFAGIREIVEGPDGSIWCTMPSVSSIGRMSAW